MSLQYCPEIPYAFFLLAVMFYGPISEQYLYQFYSDELGYNYTAKRYFGDCPNSLLPNSTEFNLQEQVQSKVSSFLSRQVFFQNIPPIALCLYYGPLSDRFGRKPIMLLGYVGALFQFLLCTLTVYMKWDVQVLYAGCLVYGLSGNIPSAVMAIGAYLCDMVEGEKRATRLALIEMIMFICVALSNFTSDIFLEQFGFKTSFIFMALFTFISLLTTIFILKESLRWTSTLIYSNRYLFMQVFKTVFQSRPQRWMLLCFLLILILSLIPSVTPIISTLYLMSTPLCWSATKIGYYKGVFFLVIGIGAVVGTKVLPILMRTSFVLMITFLSSAGYYVASGFSHSTLALYLSLFVAFFIAVLPPVLKGDMSMIVTGKELGCLFAFVGSVQGALTFGTSYLYPTLHRMLNAHDKPSYIFFVAALMNILPLLAVLLFLVLASPRSRYITVVNVAVIAVMDENKPLLASS